MPAICRATLHIYGLETLIFKNSHLEALERYHRKTLKQLLSLPDQTANEAVYLLAGIPPITALSHMMALHLMGAIARSPDSMLQQIGKRPVVRHTTIKTAMEASCTSGQQVLKHYETILQQSATSKSTLKFLNTDCLTQKKPSIFFSSVEDTDTDV